MTACVVPLLLCAIGVYALYKRVDVFPTFLKGAKTGLQTALSIFPTLVGLLTAVYMLRASGFIDVAGNALAPVLSFLGIPKDCAALVLLKPVSGSGGLALGSEIMKQAGADSYAGRVAAVMLGASETSLYTVSLYSGHLGLRDTRYAVPAALLGDLTAFVASAFFVRLLFA
ncbi:spore maturation protein [Intestinibacillus massiliensis]|nr:spore maturation protein [Intestinibacillus massiliensis]